jgi:hypothetical protein
VAARRRPDVSRLVGTTWPSGTRPASHRRHMTDRRRHGDHGVRVGSTVCAAHRQTDRKIARPLPSQTTGRNLLPLTLSTRGREPSGRCRWAVSGANAHDMAPAPTALAIQVIETCVPSRTRSSPPQSTMTVRVRPSGVTARLPKVGRLRTLDGAGNASGPAHRPPAGGTHRRSLVHAVAPTAVTAAIMTRASLAIGPNT